MFVLDLRTSLVTTSVMSVFMAVILFTAGRTYPKSIGGIREWAAGSVSMAVCAALFAFRDIAPTWASIILANFMFTTGLLFWTLGTRRFLNLPLISQRLMATGLCCVLALLSYWTYVSPNFAARTSMMASISSLVFIQQAWLVWRHGERHGANNFFIFCMLLGSFATILRVAASAMQGEVPAQHFLEPTPIQSICSFIA